jgi:integration host factor subunit beta
MSGVAARARASPCRFHWAKVRESVHDSGRCREVTEGAEGLVTKSELIDALAERSNLTKARAELVVNCVFDAMTEALSRGEGIEIRGFGSFTVRPYKPYSGRNPRTGEPVPVPAKRLPFFKVGKELKELVNSSRNRPITGGDDDDSDAEAPDEHENDDE